MSNQDNPSENQSIYYGKTKKSDVTSTTLAISDAMPTRSPASGDNKQNDGKTEIQEGSREGTQGSQSNKQSNGSDMKVCA